MVDLRIRLDERRRSDKLEAIDRRGRASNEEVSVTLNSDVRD